MSTNITYEECGLRITDNATIEELKETLLNLSFTEKNHPFHIGDMLCHLIASKEKTQQSITDKTKLSIYKTFLEQNKHHRRTLERYLQVCKTFNVPERQRYNRKLAFTHFYEALLLTKGNKDSALSLLSQAEQADFSLSEMRNFHKEQTGEVDNEPDIPVSPVVDLCGKAQELGRKLTGAELSEEESEMLFNALTPVRSWLDSFATGVPIEY